MSVFVNESLANRMIDVSNESLQKKVSRMFEKAYSRKSSRRRAIKDFNEAIRGCFGDRYIECVDEKRYQYHIFLDGQDEWYGISIIKFDKKKVELMAESLDIDYPVSVNRHLLARLTQYQKDKVAYKMLGDIIPIICNNHEGIAKSAEGSCLIWIKEGVFSATVHEGGHIDLYTFIPSDKLDTWKLDYFGRLDFSETPIYVTTKKDKLI